MAIGWSKGPARPPADDTQADGTQAPAGRRGLPGWFIPMVIFDALILVGIALFFVLR